MSISANVGAAQLGFRLAQLRQRAGLDQENLARQVTWTSTDLAQVESGERELSETELKSLVEALGSSEARSWKKFSAASGTFYPDLHSSTRTKIFYGMQNRWRLSFKN